MWVISRHDLTSGGYKSVGRPPTIWQVFRQIGRISLAVAVCVIFWAFMLHELMRYWP